MRLLFLLAIFYTLSLGLDGVVVKVSDGDTITVLDGLKTQHRVRLNGIDAPEKKQAYGHKARQYLASLISGKNVHVIEHKNDRYGRIVGTVFIGDVDINEQMVLAVYAWAYVKYDKKYKIYELKAHEKNRGLWRDCNPIPPWEFRKNK